MRGFENEFFFLNLAQWFRRFLNFSISKKVFFLDEDSGSLRIWNGIKKNIFDGFFCNFLGINTHNFAKNDAKFKSKCLLYAKFQAAWHEK